MKTVLITGSAGLIGSEAVRFFHRLGFQVVGMDNDLRQYFFGADGSTAWNLSRLKEQCPGFINHEIDIRDAHALASVFGTYGSTIELIIHCAAQPSHDWAVREPFTDFSVNAAGTLSVLEAARKHCPKAVFIFTSTNKVYGDTPNRLPLVEMETRFEIDPSHRYYQEGIDESMSIDQSTHSIFGVSKLAADIMVQEYGRYHGMKTAAFRGGCLTGPGHSAAELHGFLSYLMKCALTGREYKIFGYKGKQVRDNIHSFDMVNAFYHFYQNPRCGEVYNIGGGRFSNCSLVEAIKACEAITGKAFKASYVETNRVGDHIWWISDVSKFKAHYPGWALTRNVHDILQEIFTHNKERWLNE